MDHVRGEPDVEFDFDHEATAGRHARHALNAVLAEPGDPMSDDVRLAASELVTNVVLHTDDGGSMRAWEQTIHVPLRLEVEDHDATPPAVRRPPPAIGGQGLHIVDRLADSWGVTPTATGKVVWAEFNRVTPAPKA
ncbi:MAG: hypothetical protein JWN99_1900 [Ilumatobacteraceae bacterium]|nr:hypothetical protein [Ilumatobacteraceae bacterium]